MDSLAENANNTDDNGNTSNGDVIIIDDVVDGSTAMTPSNAARAQLTDGIPIDLSRNSMAQPVEVVDLTEDDSFPIEVNRIMDELPSSPLSLDDSSESDGGTQHDAIEHDAADENAPNTSTGVSNERNDLAVPNLMSKSKVLSLATHRLQTELLTMQTDPPPGCRAELKGDSIFEWKATIEGPVGSVYEGGHFDLSLVFGSNYPFTPPKVKFITRIYHCNISKTGYICLDILRNNWSAALTVPTILLSVISLLNDCNPNDPQEPEIAMQYLKNRKTYDETAKMFTTRYAKKKN